MKKIFNSLKNPLTLRIFIAVIASILVSAGVLFYLKTTDRISIENSMIVTPITTLAPTTPGKLKKVLVTEGDKVKKGDTVAIVGTEVIRSDFDGIVTSTDKSIGSLASAQTPVVQLIDLNDMRVDGTIDENKGLNQIHIGQVVSFTVDALPGKTFWGYVDEVSPSAKQTAAAFSISSERPTQQFEVFAHFDAANYADVKNGMSAKMTVYTRN